MIEYWIWLSMRNKVGAKTVLTLLEQFGTIEAVYQATRDQLIHVHGMNEAMLSSLLDKDLLSAQKVLSDCFERGIQIVTLHEDRYPSVLRAINDPPLVLYYLGKFPELENRPVISIVGSRIASAYGLSNAERLGYMLHRGGCTIVSGMAKGIDGAAMRGALKAGNRVIAVLGCGVDRIYPRENEDIYNELSVRGCIVSEYPPKTAPLAEHFPVRNRIISGLSDGIVVVEAAKSSGSLITAEHALEQNRDVFAVPGNIGLASCVGSNRLLKNGAELVESATDILQAYSYRYPDAIYNEPDQSYKQEMTEKTIDIDKTINYIDLNEISSELSEEGIAVLKALGTASPTMDELIEQSGLCASKAISTITLLEIKGYVQRLAGNRFRRIR